ncbi:hypothetical protein KTR9_4698 [Gordonia sp. KTR9]|nr:hypothetical protein KTR9_4698 [Gordonia sp. KTR9]
MWWRTFLGSAYFRHWWRTILPCNVIRRIYFGYHTDLARGHLPCARIPSPGTSEELVELGLHCPAGGSARIIRTRRLHGSQPLDLGTHAVVLNPTPTLTQLFVLYAGT